MRARQHHAKLSLPLKAIVLGARMNLFKICRFCGEIYRFERISAACAALHRCCVEFSQENNAASKMLLILPTSL
jgi:hypothetical protein